MCFVVVVDCMDGGGDDGVDGFDSIESGIFASDESIFAYLFVRGVSNRRQIAFAIVGTMSDYIVNMQGEDSHVIGPKVEPEAGEEAAIVKTESEEQQEEEDATERADMALAAGLGAEGLIADVMAAEVASFVGASVVDDGDSGGSGVNGGVVDVRNNTDEGDDYGVAESVLNVTVANINESNNNSNDISNKERVSQEKEMTTTDESAEDAGVDGQMDGREGEGATEVNSQVQDSALPHADPGSQIEMIELVGDNASMATSMVKMPTAAATKVAEVTMGTGIVAAATTMAATTTAAIAAEAATKKRKPAPSKSAPRKKKKDGDEAEDGDAEHNGEALKNARKSCRGKDLPEDTRVLIVAELRTSTTKSGDLPHGMVSRISERFGVHRRTVNRLWHKSKDTSVPITTVVKSQRHLSGRTPKYDAEELQRRIAELPLDQRTSIRVMSRNLGVPVSTVHRLMQKQQIHKYASSAVGVDPGPEPYPDL
jgi:hypothetical protein